jgi:hypothetical protein
LVRKKKRNAEVTERDGVVMWIGLFSCWLLLLRVSLLLMPALLLSRLTFIPPVDSKSSEICIMPFCRTPRIFVMSTDFLQFYRLKIIEMFGRVSNDG